MTSIANNIKHIYTRIDAACKNAGRNPAEVKLLLATKTVSTERIQTAIDLGETLLGENKVQELKLKAPLLTQANPSWHFIGHLQSNKIKDVVQHAHCIQTIDRLSLAQKLQKRLKTESKDMEILIQVNTSLEDSKFGCSIEETLELVKNIAPLNNMHIKGLMTIGLFSKDKNKVRACFQQLRQLRDDYA